MTDDSKKVAFSASFYSGAFSILPSRADILHLNTSTKGQATTSSANHIIYLINVGSSLTETRLAAIKRALRSNHNSFASVTLLPFAAEVQKLAHDQVEELKCSAEGANLELALRTGFELATTNTGFTGLVLLTGGTLSAGCLEVAAFRELLRTTKPKRSFIEVIAYDEHANVDLLEAVGRYRYAPEPDFLINSLADVKRIVSSAVATEAAITLFTIPNLTDLPEGYLPSVFPGTCFCTSHRTTSDSFGRLLIKVGTLLQGQDYSQLVFPFGYTVQPELRKRLLGRDARLSYITAEGEENSLVARIELPPKLEALPLYQYSDFYSWDAKRRLYEALRVARYATTLEEKLALLRPFLYLPGYYPDSVATLLGEKRVTFNNQERARLEARLSFIKNVVTTAQSYLELLLKQMSTTGVYDPITVAEVHELINN